MPTTIIVAMPNEKYILSPENSIPAIATIARDEHGAARRRGGSLEGGAMALARGALLTLTLDVEERVVDADGQADQQHDRSDVLIHAEPLARDREQADRRHHAGERDDDRHGRRDEGAEDEE